jgi:hypothetical protein
MESLTHISLHINLAMVKVPFEHDAHEDEDEDDDILQDRLPSLARVDVVFRSCPRDAQEAELIAGVGFLKACQGLGLLHTTLMYLN